jgi:hypothetical protein
MARIRLEQILAPLRLRGDNELVVTGSVFFESGSIDSTSGSLTIEGYDTFGDKDSPDIIDLGSF